MDTWSIFTGAGVSQDAPSDLPSGLSLRNRILREVCDHSVRAFASNVDLSAIFESEWKLEFVLGKLSDSLGKDRACSVLKGLRVYVPNRTHMLLAGALIEEGVQATLNFDQGIELAYWLLQGTRKLANEVPDQYHESLREWRAFVSSKSLPPLTIVSTRDEFDRWNKKPQRPVLFKLHGGIEVSADGRISLREAVVTDEAAFLQLPRARLAALDELTSLPILVLAYSGLDIDVYDPLLRRLAKGPFTWASHSVSPTVAQDLCRIAAADGRGDLSTARVLAGDIKGNATRILEEVIGKHPMWPSAPLPRDRFPGFKEHFDAWAESVRGPRPAEAMARMLSDVREYDAALEILKNVARHSHPTPHTRLWLASAYYHRNRRWDKIRACVRFFRTAMGAASSDRGLQLYALMRTVESMRSALPLATILGGLGIARLARRVGDIEQEALSMKMASATLHRVCEALAPSVVDHERLWAIFARGADLAESWAQRAATLVSSVPREAGLPLAEVRVLVVSAQALRAILTESTPPPDALESLKEMLNMYERLPEPRGRANTVAAMALVQMAFGELDIAADTIRQAHDLYCIHREDIDPSGARLIARRRRLLLALRLRSGPTGGRRTA